jgi:hypothetical protein
MKYLKILGLAAVAAAALMAFVGAGTASAETTACELTEEPCTTHGWGVGTEVVAHNEVEPPRLTAAGGLVEVICQKSTIEGSVTAATTPVVALSKLTFEECNNTVEVLKPGELVLHHDENKATGENKHNGNITVRNFRVRIKASGLTCTFGGEIKEGITLTSGGAAGEETKPTVDATAEIKLEEGFFCPSTGIWHAKYLVTKPKPLYITTGL